MNRERWSLVRSVFERARACDEGEERSVVLAELADDAEGLDLVRKMLAADAAESSFLSPPTVMTEASAPEAPERVPEIEGFSIRGEIAGGGMGIVYEAEQLETRRRVALKIMRVGLASPRARRRFQDEIRTLALLRHPGIAQIYETGILTDGFLETPWFSMELVEGALSITRFADERGLDVVARVALLAQVADAVHHGHQRGVIHRDLKPANLLVDGSGNGKVIDFGVARVTEPDFEDAIADRTRPGELLGTLRYMSPEQIGGRPEEVDTRTDVYSLGVVLYELLSGRAPFELDRLSLADAGRVVRETEPPSLDEAQVPRELRWIVGRALAKEKERRYGGVAEFAADLRRFLGDEPVAAGPPTVRYRLSKFVARHRGGVAVGVVALLGIFGGLFGTGLGLWRALAAEREAAREARTAETAVDFLVDVLASPDPVRDGRDVRVVEVLERAEDTYRETFGGEDLVRARLEGAFARVYYGLGVFERAEEHGLRWVELLRGREGRTEELADAVTRVGMSLLKLGDLERSEKFLRQAHALDLELWGEDSPAAWRSLSRIGLVLVQSGRHEEGRRLIREAIDGLRRHLGDDHHEVHIAVGSLAASLQESLHLEEALELYTAAYDGLTRSRGSDDPETLLMRHNGVTLRFQIALRDDDPDRYPAGTGPFHECVRDLRELFELRRRKLGDDHLDTLTTQASLVGTLLMVEEPREALELGQACLEGLASQVDLSHLLMQTLEINLAQTQARLGDLDGAEERFRRVYDHRVESSGVGSEPALKTRWDLKDLAKGRGEVERAFELAREGWALAEEHLGPEHYMTFRYACELGPLGAATGHFEEGERALLRALDLREQLTMIAPALADPEQLLDELYRAWDRDTYSSFR